MNEEQPAVVNSENHFHNRMLSRSGHELRFDDNDINPTVILKTLGSEHYLELNAHTQAEHYIQWLARLGTISFHAAGELLFNTDEGDIKVSAGGYQHIDAKNSVSITVEADSISKKDSLELQSATHINHTAKEVLLESDGSTSLLTERSLKASANDTIIWQSEQGNLSINVPLGSTLINADGNINIEGTGSGDITLFNQEGMIKLDSSGNVELIGKDVLTLNGQIITFDGDVSYDIESPEQASEPSAAQPPTIGRVASFSLGGSSISPVSAPDTDTEVNVNAEVNTNTVTSEKIATYEENQALLEKTAGIAELENTRERLALNNDSILRAEAAEYVYKVDEFNRGHITELPPAPEGLELIDPSTIPGLEDAIFTDKESGFGAALMKSTVNGETMLVYRGTNNGVTGKKDWATNGKQGVGKETAQYTQAMKLADDILEYIGEEVVIVGHSLGGGLASAGVAVTGLNGNTYNSAGLHPDTAERFGAALNNAEAGQLITSQHVDGEVLTGAQKHGDNIVSALIGALGFVLGGPGGATTGIAAQKLFLDDVPQAIGTMKELPSIDGGNPVTRHGMDQVIEGIQAQIDEDTGILKQYIRDYYD
jgi:hypothetical protein